MGKVWLVAAVLLLALSLWGASARHCPLLHAPDSANKTGCYIIVLKENTTSEKVVEVLQRATSLAEGNKVYGFVQYVSKAFTLKLSAYSLALVSVASIPMLFPS